MKNIYNFRKPFFYSIFLILSFTILIYAYSTGITGVTKKGNAPGCTCHGLNPSANVIVTINGPDTLMPNQKAEYSITISGGPLKAAGTDIAVSQGNLLTVSNDLRLQNNELTHVLPKQPSDGVVTFNFTYTAPNIVGEQIIYANGNSVNFNGQNSGDEWNYAPNKIIQIGAVTGVDAELNIYTFKLEQNFPNPFNPTTTINYDISKPEYVTLKVYDILGNEIETLVDKEQQAGSFSVQFSAARDQNSGTGSPISSGVYIYRLEAGSFIQTRKMMVLK